MSPEQLQQWLQVGLAGAFLAALFLGFRRVWVWGWYAADLEKQRDQWQEMALHGLQAAADAAQAAKTHTTLTPEQAEAALKIIRDAGRGTLGTGQ